MTRHLADPPADPPEAEEHSDEKLEDARAREPSTSTKQSKSQKPRKFRKLADKLLNWDDTWSWEVGACILSAVCIVLLIGFLVFVDGTPYDSWQYQVSPNAIISVLVIVAKGTMLSSVSSCLGQLKWGDYQTPTPLYRLQALDQASRGPVGSFEVLYSVVPCLATVGALLTVLSLAMDPFSQQILAFPSHRVPAMNELAFAQKAQEYWPSWTNMFYKNIHYDSFLMTPLDPSMQLAMLSGLLGANSPLEPVCQSNDCTYPDFISLGVCSRCENVTSETEQFCIPQPHSDLSLILDNLGKANLLCTYTTPQNFQIVPSVIAVGSPTPEGVVEVFRMPFNATRRNTSLIFGIKSPIVSFAASKYTHFPYYSSDNVTAVEDKPIVTECTVYFCEKQYMNNSVTSNDRILSATRTQPLYPNYEELSNLDDVLISLNPPNGTETLSDNATYSIDRNSLHSINSQMYGLLNTSSLAYEYGQFDITSMFYSVEDLGAAMASLAESMTDNMRANPQATKISGQAFLARTSVQVRWAWILLPAGSVFLAIGLLIATVNASRKGHTVLWKSSVLPLLISGLDTRPEHDLRSLQRVSELHKLSRHTNVLLERVEGHPIFREHLDPASSSRDSWDQEY